MHAGEVLRKVKVVSYRRRHGDAEGLCGLEIDDEIELGRLLDGCPLASAHAKHCPPFQPRVIIAPGSLPVENQPPVFDANTVHGRQSCAPELKC